MSSSVIPPPFDRLSFVKYMKNIGRQYRKQAMELVSICRVFAQAQEQTFFSHDDLRRVLKLVDEALGSATDAQKRSSKEVDDKFKRVIDELSDYEKRYHWHPDYPEPTVAEKMKKAEEEDKSSLKFLNRLKENFCPLEEGPITTVEFHLHKSLPDKNPTIVKQALCQKSDVNEVLWNFSRYKDEERRLTLRQNAHFYQVLPTLPENYGGKFRTDPTETFIHEKICVLADNSGLKGRVFLETAKKKRAFGNVWVPKDAIIFKDVCGKLEGESIVGEAIQGTPSLWCSEKPPLSNTSRPTLSPNRSIPSSTTNTAATAPPAVLYGDWTGPIRQMLYSPFEVKNIHISDKPPTISSLSHSAPSSPTPWCGSSSRTARSTPLVRQPLAAVASPRSPADPSPGLSSILPTRSMSTPAPSNSAPLPVPPPLRSPTAPQLQTTPATRRPTPLPQQPQVSPRSPAPLSSGSSSVLPTRPTPTPAPSTAPLPMSHPQQSPRPATARPTPSARQPRKAGVLPRSPTPPSTGTSPLLAAQPTATPVPTTAAPSPAPLPLQSHTAASPLARQAVQASTNPLPDMSSRDVSRQGVVQTAVPPQTRKRYWYQKCFDAVKNTLTPGSS